MSRRTLIYLVLAVVLVAYIIVVVPMTIKAERTDTFTALDITVNDRNNTGFLRDADVEEILRSVTDGFDTLKRKNLNTLEVERLLNASSRVENSRCLILNDGTLSVSVDPIDPVARVFDSKGSVYVNASGKRVPAHPRYHIDVPVLTTGSVADSAMIAKVLPILRVIKSNAKANALVSSLRIDRRGDIIVIPNVVGHVINFGDSTLINNKLLRLQTFYREVMPARGWDAFDTISLKWDGRVVATKRDKNSASHVNLSNLDEIVDETLDDETMMTE